MLSRGGASALDTRCSSLTKRTAFKGSSLVSTLVGDARLSYRVNTSYLARTFPTKHVSRVINFTGSLIGRGCILARTIDPPSLEFLPISPYLRTDGIKVTRQAYRYSSIMYLSFFVPFLDRPWPRNFIAKMSMAKVNGAVSETLAGKFESAGKFYVSIARQ